jgi:hypothetical protein
MNPIHIEMLSRSGGPVRSRAAQQREQDLLRYRAEIRAVQRKRGLRIARAAWSLVSRRRETTLPRTAEPVIAPEVGLR